VSQGTRQLIVMRHAKAEQFATSDHARELLPRGVADASAAGRWAASEGVLPDYVVVSSAARTQGTWKAFARELALPTGASPEVVTDQSLYAAGTDAALEIIRSVPPSARTVMLVGHNPTMEYLVHLLDDGDADPGLFEELSSGYPTSALTILDVPQGWADIDVASARIVRFHVGRD
jgi:phosphohistidine phosphatase